MCEMSVSNATFPNIWAEEKTSLRAFDQKSLGTFDQ